MILNQYGKPVDERPEGRPSGRTLFAELSDRARPDVSAYLTPARVKRILVAADSGDASDQAALAESMLEKNDTVASAFDVRCGAVLGLEWSVGPGDGSPGAKRAAEAFEKALRGAGRHSDDDTFDDLLAGLLKSIITGYALSEIVWTPGGGLGGFRAVPAREIDFMHGFSPRVRVSSGPSVPAPKNKFVFAHCRKHGADPVRGGLIRPLAWLHCFIQTNIKDMLSFTERYAMPVVIATVSDDKFENERAELLRMIRNFGPNGGGLVTQGTTIEAVQAGNTTGEIYLRILTFFRDAVHRLLLGQTATSGDGGGLSKDNAQSEVRQDILEADARFLASVVESQIAAPWMLFNMPPGTPAPSFKFDVAPPEDKSALAVTVKTLFEAGWRADANELCERFGLKLTPREEGELGQDGQDGQAEAAGMTPTKGLEEYIREKLGLGPLPEEAAKLWNETGGVRKPLTIKDDAEAAAPAAPAAPAAQNVQGVQSVQSVQKAPAAGKQPLSDAAPQVRGWEREWFGPLEQALSDLLGAEDEETFLAKAGEIGSGKAFGSSRGFEEHLESTVYGGLMLGAAAQDRKLAGKDKK